MKTLILGLMPEGATPQSHIAAGPWCFCGQEDKFPGCFQQFTFAPEPLADPERLPASARAAQCLCVKLIPITSALLAPRPDLLPPQYWQILLTPWLIDLASQLVERALRCQALLDQWGTRELQVPVLPEECEFNFANEQDFTLRGDLGIAYNHWLFSRLLEKAWPTDWQKIELAPVKESPQGTPGLAERGRNFIRRLSLKLAFPRLKGMSFGQAMQLSSALGHTCKTPDRSLDFAKAFAYEEDLEKIPLPENLHTIVEKSLPASIRSLAHKPIKKRVSRPEMRIASIVAHEDSEYRQSLAYWRASGNRIAHCQHGGNYGLVKVPCAAEIEEYSQDIFFSWGWSKHGCAKGNFMPLPSLQLSGKRESWEAGENLVFVGAEMAAFPYRLDSRPTPLQFISYREAKAVFFEALDADLIAMTLYRPYFPVSGTLADADWLLPQFPGLKLCTGPLLPQIQNCRLLILDHHGTTLLEALAAGIPFICYWRPEYWPLTPAGEVLLDMFAEAGIWQPGPAQAAKKVREIWENPKAWLESSPVKMARKVFAINQALSAPDALAQWQMALEKL